LDRVSALSSLFGAFIAISLLLAVTPGPDMALVKNALSHGPRGVFATTTGIAAALVLWVTASAVGVAAVLKASTTLFYDTKGGRWGVSRLLGIRAWLASREKPSDLLARRKTAPAGAVFALIGLGVRLAFDRA
jgi:homoserine/homoserine lactone efflux protein